MISEERLTRGEIKLMKTRSKVPAIAYLRTSSAANVGTDKDSEKRQRAAVEGFARANGYEIECEFYDAAVSGADAVTERPGFLAMLQRIAGNGIKTIIVESPDRFARDLAVQLAGHDMLKGLGIDLIPASAPDHFLEDTPTAVLVRQVLGAIAQFEKASLVAKLKAARDRKRTRDGKCEGRRSHREMNPELVALAKRLRRRNSKTGERKSFRAIAAELAAMGHVNIHGRPFAAESIKAMVQR
jgi:DNA invertase Pin-like site-specific DNA recombinase